MSYVFLPPRTTNYFPAGVAYLAGLGNSATDVAAYKELYRQWSAYKEAYRKWEIDNKKWAAEKKAYDKAYAEWDATVSSMSAAYRTAYANYEAKKKQWDSDYATYTVAVNAWGRAWSEYKAANSAKAKQIATTFNLKLPQSFFDNGACISKSDYDYFVKNCVVVKGLGAPVSYGSECGMRRLPVCDFPAKPTIGPEPKKPAKPVYPTEPTLRAQPVPPVEPKEPLPVITPPTPNTNVPTTIHTDTPVVVKTPTPVTETTPTPVTTPDPIPAVEPPADTKQSNMLMSGLILVAVLGGGYLVYRTLKKPKAKAA